MLERIKSFLADVPHDGAIYLAEKLSAVAGFFITSGHLLYLVANFENTSHTNFTTDCLRLNTDVEIKSFKNNQQFSSGKYNILEFVPTEAGYNDNQLDSFINLCVAHAEFMQGKSFVNFFFTLSEIFQPGREQHYKNLVGFFGELSFIKNICKQTGVDLSVHWHKGGSRDKYEISLEDKNIEIKTTSAIDEEVTIKHFQLFNEDKNYLAVVCIEESSSGQTLNQLIACMLNDPDHYNNYNFVLNLEREKRRISPVDANNKKFNVKLLEIYDADQINPFGAISDRISQLTYKLDLVGMNKIPHETWLSLFNN